MTENYQCQTFYRCRDGSQIQCHRKGHVRQHREHTFVLCAEHDFYLAEQIYRAPQLRLNRTNMEHIAHSIFGGRPEVKSYGFMRMDLSRAIHSLNRREQFVLIYRFGLAGKGPLTLREIGEMLSVRRETVRQVEARAIRRLRHPSRSKVLAQHLEFPKKNSSDA